MPFSCTFWAVMNGREKSGYLLVVSESLQLFCFERFQRFKTKRRISNCCLCIQVILGLNHNKSQQCWPCSSCIRRGWGRGRKEIFCLHLIPNVREINFCVKFCNEDPWFLYLWDERISEQFANSSLPAHTTAAPDELLRTKPWNSAVELATANVEFLYRSAKYCKMS